MIITITGEYVGELKAGERGWRTQPGKDEEEDSGSSWKELPLLPYM